VLNGVLSIYSISQSIPTVFTEQQETVVLTTVADGMSVDEKSCGTCQAHDTDRQAVHLLMVPKKEPVKIGIL